MVANLCRRTHRASFPPQANDSNCFTCKRSNLVPCSIAHAPSDQLLCVAVEPFDMMWWMRVVHTSPAFLLVTSPSLRSNTRNHPGRGTGRGCGCGWVGGDFTMYSSPSSSLVFAPTRTTFNLRWERGWMIIPNPPSVGRPPAAVMPIATLLCHLCDPPF